MPEQQQAEEQGVLSTQQTGQSDAQQTQQTATQTQQTQQQSETPDYSTMTDVDYVGKVTFPEGAEVNKEEFAKNYGELLRKYKIDPAFVGEYLKKDFEAYKAQKAESDKALSEAKAAFKAEGEALKKAFNPEQIASAVTALENLGADEKFMKFATRELSNNATLVKLLINWGETHKNDTVVQGGVAGSGNDDFVKRWMGVSRR